MASQYAKGTYEIKKNGTYIGIADKYGTSALGPAQFVNVKLIAVGELKKLSTNEYRTLLKYLDAHEAKWGD